MNKAIVILNEQHTLLPEQLQILNERFDSFEVLSVPATGWTLEEITDKACHLLDAHANVIFASPIPAMIVVLARLYVHVGTTEIYKILVFHNDKREKKELPNGKIIFTVSREGWQLV